MYTAENVLVAGKQFEGICIKKAEVIKYVEDLRAQGYAIINSVIGGNGKCALEIMKKWRGLAKMLVKEIKMIEGIVKKDVDEK